MIPIKTICLLWLSNIDKYPNIQVYFIIGDGDNSISGDTIYLDCKDNYEDLSDKVLSFIKFCKKNFSYDYIIKTDDDSYINLHNLIEMR